MSNKLTQYFSDSFEELKKVSWPTRKRAINICILVVGFVLASTIVIAGLDYVFHTGYLSLFSLQQYLFSN